MRRSISDILSKNTRECDCLRLVANNLENGDAVCAWSAVGGAQRHGGAGRRGITAHAIEIGIDFWRWPSSGGKGTKSNMANIELIDANKICVKKNKMANRFSKKSCKNLKKIKQLSILRLYPARRTNVAGGVK